MMSASDFPSSLSPSLSDRVDIIGYLIDGIYIRHENSQISIIPERERGGKGREEEGAFSSLVPFQRGNEPDISPRRRGRTVDGLWVRYSAINKGKADNVVLSSEEHICY